MNIKIIYQDNDVLVVDKPAGLVVFEEGKNPSKSSGHFLINELIKMYPDLKKAGGPPRYGIVHRLDKDTSGILLVAKNTESLFFLQEQFKNKTALDSRFRGNDNGNDGNGDEKGLEKILEKRYITLVCGSVKNDFGEIRTLIGRAKNDPRKQKVYQAGESGSEGKREAITYYNVVGRYSGYTLLDVKIDTGRKHQIRCHFSYIHHPIAGDKLYKYRDNKSPENLQRQFLHANYLKIKLPSGQIKEFRSDLPDDLKQVLENLKK